MARIPIALQMYTVRDVAANDFVGTFRKVAALGYEGVELAGTGGLPAQELKKLLDDLGLKAAGSHIGLDQLENSLPEVLDYNETIGNPYIVCPWMPEDRRKTGDGWRQVAATMNEIGAKVRQRGMQFCYHNHAFEFEKFGGETGLDILFGSTDPKLVKSELDLFWVETGGESAAAYIRKYAGRVPLVHLKDMTEDDKRTFAEVGEGRLDWPAVFQTSEASGVEWYIVEQDTCQRPSLESVEISLNNLRKWGKL